MKLNKLLAAVSIAALTASSANALDILVNAPATVVTPATELEFPQPVANTASLDFDLRTQTGNFPAGNNIVVEVTLPAGTSFATAAVGGNVTDGAGGGGGLASAVLQSDGAVGDTEATFLVSIPNGAAIGDLNFDFDIRLDSCVTAAGPLSVTANIDGSNTPIENGVALGTDAVAPCIPALTGVVADDEASFPLPAVANPDTFIQLANFDSINDPVIGFVNYEFSGAARSIDGTPADDTDLSLVTFDVVFDDANTDAYVGTVSLVLNTGSTLIGSSNMDGSYTFSVSGGDLATLTDGVADEIVLVLAAGNVVPVPTQQVRVANATVFFNDTNANFIPSKDGATGNIDLLNREGQTFGSFDWNGSAGTNSIYRVTGLPIGEAVDYTVTFERSTPPSVNNTYSGTLTSDDGEAVLTSFSAFGVDNPPTYERADISMNFEIAPANAAIDVDRLLARSGIVTNFGDGSNQSFSPAQPLTDADNAAGNSE